MVSTPTGQVHVPVDVIVTIFVSCAVRSQKDKINAAIKKPDDLKYLRRECDGTL